jgi:hypothetical protein
MCTIVASFGLERTNSALEQGNRKPFENGISSNTCHNVSRRLAQTSDDIPQVVLFLLESIENLRLFLYSYIENLEGYKRWFLLAFKFYSLKSPTENEIIFNFLPSTCHLFGCGRGKLTHISRFI